MSILLYRDKLVTQHNELGIWALNVKNFLYFNALPNANSNLLNYGHNPITGFWNYYFCRVFTEFKDENIYISSALLQYSLVIAITSLIKEDKKIRNVLINISFIGFLFIVSYLVFTSLYVDTILGLTAIFILLYMLNIKEKVDKSDLLIIFISFIFLSLLKETSIAFVIVSLIIFLFKGIKLKNSRKEIFFIFLLLIVLLIVFNFLWNYYLKINKLNDISGDISNLNLDTIIEFLKGDSLIYRYETLKDYLSYLTTGENFKLFNINVSVISLLLITILVMLNIYIIKKDKNILSLMFSIIIENILFLGALLIVYLFVFAEWEAKYLSAIPRYVQTVNIINICALLYVLYEKFSHKNVMIISIFIIITLSGTNRGILEIINNEEKIQKTIVQREKYNGIEKYRSIFNENDKIYLVTEYEDKLGEGGKREIDLLSIKYQITPFRVYMFDESVVSEEEIINKLNCDYTYVYFYNVNKDIIERYSFLLKEGQFIEENSLFKLYEENNKLKIDKVEV